MSCGQGRRQFELLSSLGYVSWRQGSGGENPTAPVAPGSPLRRSTHPGAANETPAAGICPRCWRHVALYMPATALSTSCQGIRRAYRSVAKEDAKEGARMQGCVHPIQDEVELPPPGANESRLSRVTRQPISRPAAASSQLATKRALVELWEACPAVAPSVHTRAPQSPVAKQRRRGVVLRVLHLNKRAQSQTASQHEHEHVCMRPAQQMAASVAGAQRTGRKQPPSLRTSSKRSDRGSK